MNINHDAINGAFEMLGTIFVWLNVYRVIKDKDVKGQSLLSILFFTSWGFWNITYYSALMQPLSSAAAICMSAASFTYFVLVLYYVIRNEKERISA